MNASKIAIPILALVLLIVSEGTLFSSTKEMEFDAIGKLNLKQLTSRAKAALDKKYPGENWEKYRFPKYVYIHEAVETAYKIAVKRPELLAKFPCYCFCQDMGHKNLAYCFLEKGAVGKFDDHASSCNICVTQALAALLWDEIGATEGEMQNGMKQFYGK